MAQMVVVGVQTLERAGVLIADEVVAENLVAAVVVLVDIFVAAVAVVDVLVGVLLVLVEI